MIPDALRLSELCALIDETITEGIPETCWVMAEIASLSERGHCYLDLIEKGQRGILSAKVRATCWSDHYTILSAYFLEQTGQMLRPGLQVLVEVEVCFHAVYGLSLNIVGIDPSFTLGDLARQRQETIRRLTEDGVMELNRMLPLPTLLRRIAVISSETAAGYGDFVDQLTHNAQGFAFSLTPFPAIMQGDQAERSVVAALSSIAERENEFDCVVIIRGGGATTDLTCFDGYDLAFHAAQFPLPVLTGIGHTRDVSVLDMVAHSALKTPTAVAEFILSHQQEQWERILDLEQRITLLAQRLVEQRQAQIDQLDLRLRMALHAAFLAEENRISMLEKTLALLSPEAIFAKGYALVTSEGHIIDSAAKVHPGQHIITEFRDGKIESVVE